MKFYILNGPNLNLLGKREPEIYGTTTFEEYFEKLSAQFDKHYLSYFQSNHEGALIDKIQEIGFQSDGIVFNPAAYTHTSIALADTVKAIPAPVVEVHISNIYQREEFRHKSFLEMVCSHRIYGKGLGGYAMAIEYLIELNQGLKGVGQ